jgi:rare lipoprotein A
MAAWYGDKFNGRKTASGERFNMHELTAAHRTLPFNSLVKVTNLNNKASVVVRINDRGPFARNRIIDLSRAAAPKIGLDRSGTAPVRIELAEEGDK